ncbi:hypothetical protein BDZ45DRAFT_796360 [Acephala macrosclerotiorum]|nr:hypothetical protein BDZ45DRAFT_796360 [Acephala macrosclerotiorum]
MPNSQQELANERTEITKNTTNAKPANSESKPLAGRMKNREKVIQRVTVSHQVAASQSAKKSAPRSRLKGEGDLSFIRDGRAAQDKPPSALPERTCYLVLHQAVQSYSGSREVVKNHLPLNPPLPTPHPSPFQLPANFYVANITIPYISKTGRSIILIIS